MTIKFWREIRCFYWILDCDFSRSLLMFTFESPIGNCVNKIPLFAFSCHGNFKILKKFTFSTEGGNLRTPKVGRKWPKREQVKVRVFLDVKCSKLFLKTTSIS